jgi:hypothetical protein
MEGDEPSINQLIEQLKRIRIQEARLIDQIERAARRTERGRGTTHVEDDYELPTLFRVGDRITITNWVKPGLPTGVVTRLVGERVYVTTDDGTYTWRLQKNLAYWH